MSKMTLYNFYSEQESCPQILLLARAVFRISSEGGDQIAIYIFYGGMNPELYI